MVRYSPSYGKFADLEMSSPKEYGDYLDLMLENFDKLANHCYESLGNDAMESQ